MKGKNGERGKCFSVSIAYLFCIDIASLQTCRWTIKPLVHHRRPLHINSCSPSIKTCESSYIDGGHMDPLLGALYKRRHLFILKGRTSWFPSNRPVNVTNERVKITLGEHDESTAAEAKSLTQEVGPNNVIIHPNYNPEAFDNNDMALVKLNTPVNWQAFPNIRPICLPGRQNVAPAVGTTGTVAGWGVATPWTSGMPYSPLRVVKGTGPTLAIFTLCAKRHPNTLPLSFPKMEKRQKWRRNGGLLTFLGKSEETSIISYIQSLYDCPG